MNRAIRRGRGASRPLAVLATIVALGMTGAVTPVMAGKADRTTSWVDDDGTAGLDSCAGTRPVRTKIQVAIEVADRWDTIKVCPGTYDETIDLSGPNTRGMTVVSVVKHGAVVTGVKVSDTADVTVRGFAWTFQPTDGCAASGVTANGVRVTIQGMRLTVLPLLPDSTRRCSVVGIVAGGTDIVIRGNTIVDATDAIDVDGLATVIGNRITSTAVLRDIDEDGCQGTALTITTTTVEARSRVVGNTIQGPRPGTAIPRRRVWCTGIDVQQRVDVVDNTISGAQLGIDATEWTLVEGNAIDHTSTGIEAREYGTIRRNTLRSSEYGLHARSGFNRIIENDLRGNSALDCQDTSEPNNGSFPENFGTGNRWLRNRGLDAFPAAICKRTWS